MPAKRQNWKVGAILELNAHGYLCQAQMLECPEIAFFDPLEPHSVLFRLWVHNSAYTKGRWLKVGKRPIPEELREQVARFKKDPISGVLSIYINGSEIPASLEDCSGLECAVVWEPEHVEDRLRDHCLDQENIWVKSLAILLDS